MRIMTRCNLDNSSGVRAGAGDLLQMNNPYDIGLGERGLSQFNAKLRWVTLVSNWQFGGVLMLQSGMFNNGNSVHN